MFSNIDFTKVHGKSNKDFLLGILEISECGKSNSDRYDAYCTYEGSYAVDRDYIHCICNILNTIYNRDEIRDGKTIDDLINDFLVSCFNVWLVQLKEDNIYAKSLVGKELGMKPLCHDVFVSLRDYCNTHPIYNGNRKHYSSVPVIVNNNDYSFIKWEEDLLLKYFINCMVLSPYRVFKIKLPLTHEELDKQHKLTIEHEVRRLSYNLTSKSDYDLAISLLKNMIPSK